MNGDKRQQRNGQRAWQVGAVMAVTLVANFSTPAQADQTSREAAARRWYAAQGLPNRPATGSREYPRPVRERQEVSLTTREAGGARTRHQLTTRAPGSSMPEPTSVVMTTMMVPEDLPVSQTLITVINNRTPSCGVAALPTMGLTAVGLLGFSGLNRRRPQSQNQW